MLALLLSAATLPAWTETFDILDAKRWEVQLYSFPANGCVMRSAMVEAHDGVLALSVAALSHPDDGKTCAAGEIGSLRFFTYGLFEVRMQPAAVAGGVSAFFLMNQWLPTAWEHKEIDIEFVGNRRQAVQLTTHDFQNGGRDWKSAPATIALPFDYAAAAHDYAILWTPTRIRWFVDGKPIHDETRYVPHEPLQIRANVYVGAAGQPGVTAWLGPYDGSTLPGVARYGSIRYFPLDHLPPGYDPG